MDQHGPLFVVAGILVLAGIQMLATGLLGELEVNHYYSNIHNTAYSIDRMVRMQAPEEPSLL
jgi:hypothetical protein